MNSAGQCDARWVRAGSIASLAAVFLVVLGARVWLIDRFGGSVPYLDQWNGEAEMVLVPWLNATLRPTDLLLPHNEHRIVLSRVETLLLFIANGQWDPQLEAVCNAIFQAASLTFLAGVFQQFVTPRTSRIVLCSFILLGALPIGWENTLVGFQSSFYFVLFFSMIALLGLGTCAVRSPGWWAGVAAGALACLALASGFFAMVCVLGFMILRLARNRLRPIDHGTLVTAFVCLAFVVVAIFTRTDVPGHAVFHVQSLSSFGVAFARCLAWPWPERPWLAALIYLPLLGLLYRNLAGGDSSAASAGQSPGIFLVGAWVILQAAAIAWARGGPGNGPASRYADILALGLIVNLCALLLLSEAGNQRRPPHWLRGSLAAVWISGLLAGVFTDSRENFAGALPAFRAMVKSQESLLRRYVLTGDEALLRGKIYPEIPYPESSMLIRLLGVAALRENLPAPLRAPLPLLSTAPSVSRSVTLPSPLDRSLEIAARDFWMVRSNAPGDAKIVEVAFGNPGRLPFVECQTAGSSDRGATRLAAIQSDAAVIAFRPPPGNPGWRVISFPRKSDRLEMRATASGADNWVAFTRPVELGRLSHWSNILRRQGKPLVIAGAALLAASLLTAPWFSRSAVNLPRT